MDVGRTRDALARAGHPLAGSRPPASARLVTHRHISDADVEFSVEVTRELVQEGPMGA